MYYNKVLHHFRFSFFIFVHTANTSNIATTVPQPAEIAMAVDDHRFSSSGHFAGSQKDPRE